MGDYVTLHTGTGPFDFNNVRARVMAITIGVDNDNGELIVIPELQVVPSSIEPNSYMCGAYTLSELTTPQQVFWQIFGGDCGVEPVPGKVEFIGTIPALEGWRALVDIADFSFHAIARSVPGGLTLLSAVLNGDLSTGTVIASAYKAVGTDYMTIDATIPLFATGDEITFWFTPSPGDARAVLNNASTGPTYVSGGLA